ncbi:hypothetical protein TruAng_009442 [Truncatella angustata]|nr:hypothetical protein TruAng_009442 [Truncatella angustata]
MSGRLATFAAMGGAHALATREAGCSLTFTTGGALSYPVGQISSGQTRAGGGLSAVSLTLESTSLTDSQGRGCWWTPPSTVLQCDVNQVPDSGFEIGCDGSVSYNGQTEFYECDAGEGDQINIYLQKPDTGLNCAQITLTASGCYPSDCSEGNNSASQSATASQPSAGTSQGYPTIPGTTAQSTSAGSSSAPATPSVQSTGAGATPAYSVSTQSQTKLQETTPKPEQPTQTPSTVYYTSVATVSGSCTAVQTPSPVTSTVYSTSLVTVSGSCHAVETPTPGTSTVYSTSVVTVTGPASQCTPVTVSAPVPVPETETETQPAPTTTTQTSKATIPVYDTSILTTTQGSTIKTTATRSTQVTIPVYSTSIATESTMKTATMETESTAPVYATSVATESSKSTESVKTTVPVYHTSVATQSTKATIPVTQSTKTTATAKSTIPIYSQSTKATDSVKSSAPVYSNSIPTRSSVATQSTKTTESVKTSTPAYPTTLSQKSSTPAASTTPASTPSTTGGVYVPSPSTVDIPDTCPANGVKNAGEFNLPSLIIVTDKSSPSTASGTQYNADISSTKSTIFNFDIPASASGKTCQLSFLFPMKDTLETSDFSFSGSGALDFSKLSNAATQTTSYSNAPDVASDLGQFTVSPGNAYKIYSFACPSGTTIGFEVADVSGGDTSLNFFQDYNPCPIGLFITTS